jgi:hypothetical protein
MFRIIGPRARAEARRVIVADEPEQLPGFLRGLWAAISPPWLCGSSAPRDGTASTRIAASWSEFLPVTLTILEGTSPFNEGREIQAFFAREEGRVVGRMLAEVDRATSVAVTGGAVARGRGSAVLRSAPPYQL